MDKTELHEANLRAIEDFLTLNKIAYTREDKIFFLNEGKFEIRYVDSENHKMDYEARFGIKGIPHNYFANITRQNKEKGIRTMWIKDWEIVEHQPLTKGDETVVPEYHRKWEVLKSYIKTGVGQVEHRYYARDCEIKVISNREARPFLEENCFYGYRGASITLGLFATKDKGEVKAGTLLMLYSFGHPFFGKGLYDIEVIRVSTKLNHQVVGGASKLLAKFIKDYPTVHIGGKNVVVNKVVFIVDADHNDARSLETLGFTFVSHKGFGFMNVDAETGKATQRQPMKHKEIMEKMRNGEMYSVANAGSIIYMLERESYLAKLEGNP